MSDDIVDKLLGLPPEELKRWGEKKKKKFTRKGHRKLERPERTKEQLAEYLRKSGFRTRDQLRAGRHEGDPTDDDYRQAYGTWTNAVKEVFNIKPVDREYVIKSVIEFNLWRRDDYRIARKNRPDIFPSERVVIESFGGWRALKKMAAAMSLRKTIDRYLALKIKLGKKPTIIDCEVEGVIIDAAIKVYGSKNEFDKFIESLEDML